MYFNDEKLYNEAYNKCHYEETEKLHNQIEKRTWTYVKFLDTFLWTNY